MTMMRIRWIVCFCVALGLIGTAAAFQPQHDEPAGAGNAATAHDAAGHEGGHSEHGDKPELLQWDFGTAFWSIAVFVVLLVILRVAAWKPILTGLQSRERFITDSLEGAKREREETRKMLADHAKKMEAAQAEATAIVEEGRRDAEAVRRKIHDDANKEATEIAARARRDIQLARDAAISELYDRTLDLASSVAGKIVHKQLTPADHKALLDESMDEMAKTANR
jgi:F-type H+-transporting ATPase subunit b